MPNCRTRARHLPTVLTFLFFLLFSCGQDSQAASGEDPPLVQVVPVKPAPPSSVVSAGTTIEERFPPPANFVRTKVAAQSFGAYLRNLPLRPAGAKVRYYNGTSKAKEGVYVAVVDLPIGNRDLHQCADAVMRLRAEYLWAAEQYDKIHFNFTNGFRVDYSKWMQGNRIRVNGNDVRWVARRGPSNTYEDFWKYLELIFAYAGTASLDRELVARKIEEATIGDVLIQGGYPGHAIILVDEAVNPATGQRLYLLAQSYMPAQEIQILQNPRDQGSSPWYSLVPGLIETPEWRFTSANLKRFAD